MKASKTERLRVNRLRRRGAKRGKRNGVLGPWAFDFGSRGPHTNNKVYERQRSVSEPT